MGHNYTMGFEPDGLYITVQSPREVCSWARIYMAYTAQIEVEFELAEFRSAEDSSFRMWQKSYRKVAHGCDIYYFL